MICMLVGLAVQPAYKSNLHRLLRQRDRDGKDVVRVIKDRNGNVLTSQEDGKSTLKS